MSYGPYVLLASWGQENLEEGINHTETGKCIAQGIAREGTAESFDIFVQKFIH